MGRPPRDTAPGRIHHAYNRGNRQQVIFHKPGDYKAFIRVLVEAKERFDTKLLAFCVMNNHWHLVVQAGECDSISAYLHWVTSTHVHRYQAHYEIVGSGHVYQARFKNRPCKSERHLFSLIRYVEANPVEAGLVHGAETWRYSSLSLRVHGDPNGLLTPCPIALPSNWVEYINQTAERPLKTDLRESPGRVAR